MLKNILISYAIAQSCLFADSVLPPSRLEVKDGYNMYLEGQFLWWVSKVDNLNFCQDGPQTSPLAPGVSYNGHLKELNTGFTPGGRLTFGGLLPYDNWDLHFTWTYFTQDSSAKSTNPCYYIGNNFGVFSSIASYAKGKYSMTLNMLDAIMTRPSWMGERFSISPYIGARGTWLDQKFTTYAGLNYDAAPGLELGNGNSYDIKNRARSDFRGAGLLAGFGLRYELKGGWCIEGNFLTSGIYGQFTNYFSGYYKPASNDTSFNDSNRYVFTRDPLQSMLLDLELKLGFGYNRFVDQGRYLLSGGIAWEEVIFFNGNRLPIYTSNLTNEVPYSGPIASNPSNIMTLQGLTVRFMFGF